jgi:PRTRC genetic system ThiF family protein
MKRGERPVIDTSYAKSAKLLTKLDAVVEIVLVGCGGTGSWVAPSIARLIRTLRESGRAATARFIDPDVVEPKNIGRQNFCDAEIGLSKAVCLATRYNAAWGLDIVAIVAKADGEVSRPLNYGSMRIMVGCVDNAEGRATMHNALEGNRWRDGKEPSDIWWLDAGNAKSAGQVILGSTSDLKRLAGSFISPRVCVALPSPALLAPDILVAKPDENANAKLSCAELAMLNAQSLMVNQMVAAHLAEYLYRLTHGDLRRFRTEFDLSSGVARSSYITPDSIAAAVGKPVASLSLMAKAGSNR